MRNTNNDYEYWPFPVSDVDATAPDLADKIVFLKAASETGAQSFRFGINNYGAKSINRSGFILERGRRRWEIRLSQDDVRRLSAFTDSFAAAGTTVTAWLQGNTIPSALDLLKEHLVVPPGLKDSYVIHEADGC